MQAIVAVDLDWGIGYNNTLLFHNPEDMARFRRITDGCVVVMGRKTFESLPDRKPLPNRINIVMTRDQNFSENDVLVAHSIEELDKILCKYDTDDVYVIGGQEIYELLLDRCEGAIVTKVNTRVLHVDSYFPNLDTNPDWEEVTYTFPIYNNYMECGFSFHNYSNKKFYPDKLVVRL